MTTTNVPAREKLLTAEELYQTPDVGACELIDGRIVPMSPTGGLHGTVEFNFAKALEAFVGARKLGRVQVGEVGIITQRNPDRVRAADVLYISHDRYARLKDRGGYLDVAPELIVEVLSPDDTVQKLAQKLREYFAAGVKLVWAADPETKTVLAYRSLTDVREFKEGDQLPGDEVLPGFEAAVDRKS